MYVFLGAANLTLLVESGEMLHLHQVQIQLDTHVRLGNQKSLPNQSKYKMTR